MSSLIRHFFISICVSALLVSAYHFAFSTKEIIVTQQATPLVQTAYKTPLVVRDSRKIQISQWQSIAPLTQWFTLQIPQK